MSVVVPHKAISAISTALDPKQAILNEIGDLSGVEILGDKVLLGIFIRSEKTKGGIIRPDANIQEDVWQGKAGLVLKLGPDAFEDTSDYKFSRRIEVGEWCVFQIGDAWSVNINNVPCRVVRDVGIRMVVKDPNIVF